jgi:hypothetical protein
VTPNKENLRLWVAALRSGEFRQGSSLLRNEHDMYCCLGVACEVYNRTTGEGDWNLWSGRWEFNGEDVALPHKVASWLGVTTNPTVGRDTVTAIDANDHRMWPFSRIADSIEAFYQLKEIRG